jgi:YesN/AraC family two-component response regulator
MPHHKHEEDMLQYEYIKNGDTRGIDEAVKMFLSSAVGKLSDDTLQNAKYLFVCSMTLTTRFAIEGGMESESAYNTSDLYIQTADKCKSVDEIRVLHKDMTTHFVRQMADLKKQNVYSKPVVLSLDYIYDHLHQVITVAELAEAVSISASYLSTLFKKEMGISVSEYIRHKRVEAAENMLKYSEYTLTEISQFLAFSSFSHFATVFRQNTDLTPKEYRKKYFRKTDLISPQ